MVAIGSDRCPIEWQYQNLDRELAQERAIKIGQGHHSSRQQN